MGSISKVFYKGMCIVYSDMSEAKPGEVYDLCLKSREVLSQCAPYSAYVLVNVQNIRFNSQVIQIIKETTKDNGPYVKTTAVYGLQGFTKVLVKVVASFSTREMRTVESLEEGKEWLYKSFLEEEEENQYA